MEANAKKLLCGVALVWGPWIPILVALGYALHAASLAKATGLGVVAGGFSEIFVMYGVAGTFVAQLFAIVLLSKALTPGRPMRNFLAILSLCLSGLMIVMIGLFLWLSWSWSRHLG